MKTLLAALVAALMFAASACAAAPTAELVNPPPLRKGEVARLALSLASAEGKPLTTEDLQEVHKSRVHLLVVDQSLTDYQHIHPRQGDKAGEYIFDFAPATAHGYTIWVDFYPGGKHHVLPVALAGAEACASPCVDETPSLKGSAGGLTGTLALDPDPFRAGEMGMATLRLTDDQGASVADLEPVMGAFAHVVGFTVARPGVMHVHPMGPEPKDDAARGGPEMMLHMEPEAAGTLKVFAQVKRGGKDIFIPFTLKVE